MSFSKTKQHAISQDSIKPCLSQVQAHGDPDAICWAELHMVIQMLYCKEFDLLFSIRSQQQQDRCTLINHLGRVRKIAKYISFTRLFYLETLNFTLPWKPLRFICEL